ncbi:MAG: sulfatase [Candidatus Fermentibacteraceae bacterium]|nr:sulfatase [Candidatus Fermentibacteraceae bacterium]MBN2608515.1 sulfatase [Candidatus Fermentibacteraceae bacterium]
MKKALFSMALPAILALACGSGHEKPNVVLILIDTLRADHLGCYGYGRDTSPVIDSLAAVGSRFRRVQSQSPWTLPAMTTIMTGLSHCSHRAGMWDGVYYGIDPSLPYLPGLLGEDGYETAAFFNVLFMSSDFGFHRGFDLFDCESSIEEITARNARETVDSVVSWLETREDKAPLFLAVHFYDPHLTYDPEPPFDTLFTNRSYGGSFGSAWGSKDDMLLVNSGDMMLDSSDRCNLIDLYDGEIAYTDHQIGRLLRCLRRVGLAGNTLVIITADHGEEFLDHDGVGHGHTLYQELLNVPLVVSGPGIPVGYEEDALVGQIDILPSVLVYCGVELPPVLEGRNIISTAISDRVYPSSLILSSGGRVAVRRDDTKLHWVSYTDAAFQYDLAVDPGERLPSLSLDSALVREAQDYWAVPPEGEPNPVSLEEVELKALRNLGYF